MISPARSFADEEDGGDEGDETMIALASSNVGTCQDVLSLCDRSLNDQLKVNELQNAIINDMETRHRLVIDENASLKTEMTQWYRNPFTVGGIAISFGAILGTVLMHQASK